jgi:hypothetical protein
MGAWIFAGEVFDRIKEIRRHMINPPPWLEMFVPPQCVEHDDCEKTRELGEACWAAARNPGIPRPR